MKLDLSFIEKNGIDKLYSSLVCNYLHTLHLKSKRELSFMIGGKTDKSFRI